MPESNRGRETEREQAKRERENNQYRPTCNLFTSREIIAVMMRLHLREPRTHLSSILEQRTLCTWVAVIQGKPTPPHRAFYMELGQSQGHKGHCGHIITFFFTGHQGQSVGQWWQWPPWNSYLGTGAWGRKEKREKQLDTVCNLYSLMLCKYCTLPSNTALQRLMQHSDPKFSSAPFINPLTKDKIVLFSSSKHYVPICHRFKFTATSLSAAQTPEITLH